MKKLSDKTVTRIVIATLSIACVLTLGATVQRYQQGMADAKASFAAANEVAQPPKVTYEPAQVPKIDPSKLVSTEDQIKAIKERDQKGEGRLTPADGPGTPDMNIPPGSEPVKDVRGLKAVSSTVPAPVIPKTQVVVVKPTKPQTPPAPISITVKPPVQQQKPPVQQQKPPVQEQKPPVQEKKPPVQEQKPPVQQQKPPVQQQQQQSKPPTKPGKDGDRVTVGGVTYIYDDAFGWIVSSGGTVVTEIPDAGGDDTQVGTMN